MANRKNNEPGWLALVAKFSGDVERARQYVADLGRASLYYHTRPGFAAHLLAKYVDVFPGLVRFEAGQPSLALIGDYNPRRNNGYRTVSHEPGRE